MVNAYGNKVIITSGITGAGVSYYLMPIPPSIYFLGGGGVSVWNAPFETDTTAWYGIGIMGGVGYEITNGLSIESTFTWGNPNYIESGITLTTHATSLAITINYLAY